MVQYAIGEKSSCCSVINNRTIFVSAPPPPPLNTTTTGALEENKKLRGCLHRELGLGEGEQLPERVLAPSSSDNTNNEGKGSEGQQQGKGWRGRAETIVLLRSKVMNNCDVSTTPLTYPQLLCHNL
jgi:hypothetical protein